MLESINTPVPARLQYQNRNLRQQVHKIEAHFVGVTESKEYQKARKNEAIFGFLRCSFKCCSCV